MRPKPPPRKALSEERVGGPVGPVRTCIGCRASRPQDELIRLHLDDGSALRIGRTGPGRGAWLCRATAASCLTTAVDRRGLERAFRRSVDRSSIEPVLVELRRRSGGDAVSSA